jgi:isocitrate/isopropylmalate dehydrogenase
MTYKILLLLVDGIGPEVMAETEAAVLNWLGQ